ncbi:helix-turn-helix domain-containing protein [Nonomuraea sp. B12E4]|uniref:helix-turn-helix domain-containing protein n=1 Tax=Nonomuraea sp. B12E4 TaxID=3153564 RepID=UPI00325D7D2B
MSDTWTIGELAAHAARELRATSPQGANGRVRDLPGERLIRWYTTIGLVDPPLTRRGRVARYGRRHLLQLVAVKRLQAAGHSIAQIQAALAGATDHMLEAAADLPPAGAALDAARPTGAPFDAAHPATAPLADAPLGPVPVPQPPPPAAGPEDGNAPSPRAGHAAAHDAGHTGTGGSRTERGTDPGEPGRGRFWAERPRESAAHLGTRSGDGEAPVRGGAVVTGVWLADGVRLVLDAGRMPSAQDVQAVLAAAGPLLAVLEERELI